MTVLAMHRRSFFSLLGTSVAAWPLTVGAQQLSVPVIGFLNGASAWEFARSVAAFRQGLGETGHVEGRNVMIDFRWADGHYERLPTLAAELVGRRVSVIVANGPAALAAKATAATIPIVFTTGGDPVELGLVASLNRPGGNLTGATNLSVQLGPKQLEVLHELLPAGSMIAALLNPTGPHEALSRELQAAARARGVQVHILHASTEHEIELTFTNLAQLRASGLVIGTDAFFFSRIERLAALALRSALPAIFNDRNFALAGGLMSYGSTSQEMYHIAGVYTGRILKGEQPAELPVQRITKVELAINM